MDAPPAIIHHPQRPKNYDALCRRCGEIVHLRRQATDLLCYLASCGDGFRPALKTVYKNTGIPINKIPSVRLRLVDKGLISYIPHQHIVIDWRRIAAYAALDAPIAVPDADHRESKAAHTERLRRLFMASPSEHAIKGTTIREQIGRGHMDALTPEQRRQFKMLTKMSESEYEAWLGLDYQTGRITRQQTPYRIDGTEADVEELRESLCFSGLPTKEEFKAMIDQHEKDCPEREPLPF